MSKILDSAAEESPESVVEWRNGYLDTSGYGGGRRNELFAGFPLAEAACVPKAGDPLGEPAFRFWFLLKDGKPIIAIQPAEGVVYGTTLHLGIDDPNLNSVLPVSSATAQTRVRNAVNSREAFHDAAERLATELCGRVVPFEPGRKLTAMAEWFTPGDSDQLVVVVGSHESVDSMDDVLAYSLAWQCDRDLILVLPESHAHQTLERLPWVDTPVRVFLHGSAGVRPAVIPSRHEVLEAAASRGLRTTTEHELGDEGSAVEWLTSWADGNVLLEKVHRPTYLSWHCSGRQVLKVARSKGGVQITAGVDYTKEPPHGEEKALAHFVDAERPLARVDLAHIQARVARAIWRRLADMDRGHVEHRLQSALALGPLKKAVGLRDFRREFPAWRGEGRPGFLDFLGLDGSSRLHVIETARVNL